MESVSDVIKETSKVLFVIVCAAWQRKWHVQETL